MVTNGKDENQTGLAGDHIAKEVGLPRENNVESEHSPDVSVAPIKKKGSEGLSLKDKLALVLSCLAFLLSVTGFVYQIRNTSVQNARAQKQEIRSENQETRIQNQESKSQNQEVKLARRLRAHAYNLGLNFTLAYVGFTQTTQGERKEIANAKVSAARFLEQNTREIATALGLNPDLRIYLVEPKPGEIFEQSAFQSLSEKISYFNTEETVAAYNVGHGLTYLGVESQYANSLGKQEEFAKRIFPLYRELINRNLKILGVSDESLFPDFDGLDNVTRRTLEMRSKYDVEFGGGQ